MHRPVDDAEHQLQVLCDPRSSAFIHRDHGTSLYPPASVTRMVGAAASFSIFCRNR